MTFIHGSHGGATDYADYLVWPPEAADLISVDRLGFGKSTTSIDIDGRPRRDAVISLAEQASAIRPLLTQRHARWPILIGHSRGGPIAAQVAADYPGQVGGRFSRPSGAQGCSHGWSEAQPVEPISRFRSCPEEAEESPDRESRGGQRLTHQPRQVTLRSRAIEVGSSDFDVLALIYQSHCPNEY